MGEFDNIINEATKQNSIDYGDITDDNESKNISADEKKTFAEKMKEKKVQCFEMVDDACLDVMSSAENLKKFLAVQSRFEKYSLNNNLLIYMQKPEALRFKDFDGWVKDKVSLEGAKSFMILEPSSYTGKDGKKHRGYNAKNVFDITDVGVHENDYPQNKSYEQKALVRALVHDAPVPIIKSEQNIGDSAAVYDASAKTIYFKAGKSFDEIFPALANALAHAEMASKNEKYRVSDHEFASRCSAYVIAQKYGASIAGADIHTIPQKFEGLEAEDIKKELSDIHENVKAISGRMSFVLEKDLNKEQAQQDKNVKTREER